MCVSVLLGFNTNCGLSAKFVMASGHVLLIYYYC